MPTYRSSLPQLDDRALFLTDGGLETVLIFQEGIELPHFAACDLLRSPEGRSVLRSYYDKYARVASELGVGFILETPTWRANQDWGALLGWSAAELDEVNLEGVRLAAKVRSVWQTERTPIVIAGDVGPRGDGYVPSLRMSPAQAAEYHAHQIRTFADSEADFVSALTISYPEEAAGLARAARAASIPISISFTVETDGRLPSGHRLADAIRFVDDDTDAYPSYYMVNCAHPDHLPSGLDTDPLLVGRLGGLRPNASRLSHAQLDESEVLDDGDPQELARQLVALRRALPGLTVMGGCCGTDVRHVVAMGRALTDASVR